MSLSERGAVTETESANVARRSSIMPLPEVLISGDEISNV